MRVRGCSGAALGGKTVGLWGYDTAEHGRGCREAWKGGGGKRSMLGETGEVQWYGEMGNMSLGRAAWRQSRMLS